MFEKILAPNEPATNDIFGNRVSTESDALTDSFHGLVW